MRDEDRQFLGEGMKAAARFALAPTVRASTGASGAVLGKRAGSSLDFRDYRDYQSGDDVRAIDWGAYARSDRLVIKQYREETLPHCDLLIDGSASMALEGSEKRRAAVGLAALIAEAATNAGFSRDAWMGRGGCEPVVRGNASPLTWDLPDFDHVRGLHESLERLPPRWKRDGIRVVISDLLFQCDPSTFLRRVAQGAALVVVIQILAETDANPPERGNFRLTDSETGEVREISVDAASVKRYRESLSRFQDEWHRSARNIGARFIPLIAENVVADWRLDELVRADVMRLR
jgi:uncharacterized protein (DUF58 family)